MDEKKFKPKFVESEKIIEPLMREGTFYNLIPPFIIHGKRFHRVQCEYMVPNHPKEYVAKGIPEGGTKIESFVLRFTGAGEKVEISDEQNFKGYNPNDITESDIEKYPHLKLKN
jgi:hypothetical protein